MNCLLPLLFVIHHIYQYQYYNWRGPLFFVHPLYIEEITTPCHVHDIARLNTLYGRGFPSQIQLPMIPRELQYL